VPLSTSVDALKLHRYFNEKIAGVRASTAHAAPPSYVATPPHCKFSALCVLTNDDVIAAICKLLEKQCATDPLPTNLLKDNVDMLAPFITELFKRSMSSGAFPLRFKAAFITQLLKKPNLDPSDGKSYHILNLSVSSKLLQRFDSQQLIDHLSAWKLMPTLQSAYHANHSTETAMLRVVSDILDAFDRGDLAALM